jgi:hypothetical protein
MIFDAIGDLIAHIWKADTEIRTTSALGESESSRNYRKWLAIIFTILLILCAGLGIYFGI